MSKFEQFFASKKLMITSFIIAFIAYAIMIVIDSISIAEDLQYIFDVAFEVIMFFIAIAMYRSFSKHETNSMNIVTGAAIGILLIFNLQYGISYLITGTLVLNGINIILEVVLLVILLINHVQINSIHRSTRGRILLNQVILIVIIAYQIYHFIAKMCFYGVGSYDMISLIASIAFVIAKIFMYFMIICIETKLNAYKIDRGLAQAEGTWTDEKKAETKEKYFGK